jgi:hypothetical protein
LAGDRAGEGRALIQRGNAADLAHDPVAAVANYHAAASLLEPGSTPRDALMARNNLALALCSAGDFATAAVVAAEAHPLYERCDDRWSRHRLAGLEGRIARGLGDAEAAERHFRRALDGFLEDGHAFNATLAALDLAELYLEQARTAEVKALADTTCTALAALDCPPEAARAARLFAQAAAAERLTAALLARLRGGLGR